MDSEIYDKSVWPCNTPDLHWALSDTIEKLGRLVLVDPTNDAADYEIDCDNLPDGEKGLWKFNALRDLSVDLSEWPKALRHVVSGATLCLGSKALETALPSGRRIDFLMFTGTSILPLFVVDNTLTVRIHFKPSTPLDNVSLPRHSLRAQGLLCRIKNKGRPFFVAGSSGSILTWDGSKSTVNQSASERSRSPSREVGPDYIRRAQHWNIINSNVTTFSDMWAALPLDTPRCVAVCDPPDAACDPPACDTPDRCESPLSFS